MIVQMSKSGGVDEKKERNKTYPCYIMCKDLLSHPERGRNKREREGEGSERETRGRG